MTVRGLFIVFEGIGKIGKSTQVALLAAKLKQINTKVATISFPNRNTAIGKLLNEHLSGRLEMEEHAAHLLFSANRWEFSREIETLLSAGTTVISDRYFYSGLAYSIAKMGFGALSWCSASDRGLVSPDVLFLLDSDDPLTTMLPPLAPPPPSNLEDERYESTDFQALVRLCFHFIFEPDNTLAESTLEGPQPIYITPSADKDDTTQQLLHYIMPRFLTV